MNDPYDLLPEFELLLDDDEWDNATAEENAEALAGTDFDVRCEQLLRWLRNLDSRRAGIVAELDRLKAKLNAVENRRESVRNYLQSVMVLMGTKRVKTPIATATISPGRERIMFAAENMRGFILQWPSDVVKETVTFPPPNVSKTKLGLVNPQVLRDLPGVSVEVGEDVLTIR